MIKTRNLTPEVYYDHSRDFQLIGRLYDVIFNYLKTGEDTIYDIPSPSSINSEELELLAFTLGFKSKHNYPINQLRTICGSLSDILKYKGTLLSIERAGTALLRAEEIKEKISVLKDRDDEGNYLPSISIYVPNQLKDTNLFKDLLEYIMPAGITYSLYNNALLGYTSENISETKDKLTSTVKKSYQTSKVLTYEELQPTESGDIPLEIGDIGNGREDNAIVVPYTKLSDTETQEGVSYETEEE